jgi:hypothetical protein
MKQFKCEYWEEAKVWERCVAYFEAENEEEAKNLIKNKNINSYITEHIEYAWETETSTGNYEYDNSLETLEEI